MSNDDLKKSIAKIKKYMLTLKTLKEEMNEVFGEPKIDKNEDRRFQLRLLEVQQGSDIFGSIISVIVSIFVAIITTSLTLILSLGNLIPTGITYSIIGYQIAVAIISVVASWLIFLLFRNRRIGQIEREFKIDKKPKPQ